MDELFGAFAQPPQPFGLAVDLAFFRNEEAEPLLGLQDAVANELTVGLGDGIEVDEELLGEGTDAGHGVAGGQAAGRDGQAHLVDDLAINRRPGPGGDGNLEGGHAFTNCTSNTSTVITAAMRLSRPKLVFFAMRPTT